MEIKKKSVAPIYGFALVWVLYCLLFPLHKTWHFVSLACTSALSFIILSAIFPGKIEFVVIPEDPIRTGDDKIDSLLVEGERAVSEMRRLYKSIPDIDIKSKVENIINVTERIFMNLHDDADDHRLVKRFAEFYLPTTIKLLHTYDRVGDNNLQGENVSGMLERIDTALDTILDSYEKFFDSLFENQALDIETDIIVLENMLKQEGLLSSDFKETSRQMRI